MRIIDKVIQDEKIEDTDDREDLMVQFCVEEFGYKGDTESCKKARSLPYSIENLDKANETCIKCWSREVKEMEEV